MGRTRGVSWLYGRGTAAVLTGVLGLGAVVAMPGATGAAIMPAAASEVQAADDGVAPTVRSATEEAGRTGRQVEITSETTETTRVVANPNGTLTEEQSAGPERAQRPDGTWGPIDTTLVRRPDGALSPVATTVDLKLSDGGDAPLVEMTDHGKGLTLDWPGGLPQPVVAGATATYTEVIKDVDLQVRATSDGYSAQFVVKTPEAAKSPALDEIRMSVRGLNAEVHDPAGGSLSVEDPAGEVLFTAPEPQMWDASGVATAGGAATVAAVSEGPNAASTVAPVRTELTGRTLQVVPDQKMLSAPTTEFPVIFAAQKPDENWDMNGRTVIDSKGGHDWNFDDDANGNGKADHEGEGMGLCDDADYYMSGCGGRIVRRQYYQFTTKRWEGKRIYDASFWIRETHAYSCTPAWVNLYLTNAIHATGDDATRWPGPGPKDKDLLVDRNVAYGWDGLGSTCKGSNKIEFNDSSKEKNENLLSRVKQAAQDRKQITFGLFAGDEDSVKGWKRFDPDDARLVVTYNTEPSKPTGLRTTDPTTTCETGADRPWTNDNTPVLEAVAKDRDDQNLEVTFKLTGKSLDGKTTYDAIEHVGRPRANDGFAFQTPALADGYYTWSVQSYDGVVHSERSAVCEFAVDTVKPDKAPVIEFAADNPYRPGVDGEAGGPDVPGTFVFTSGGVRDIDHYVWGLDNDQPDQEVRPETPGGAVTVSITPRRYGLTTLYMRAVDRAGNEYPGVRAEGIDPYAKHAFEVKRPECTQPDCPPSAGWWKLEGGGSAGSDSTSAAPAHPLAFGSGASAQPEGRVGRAVHFDGTEDGYGQTGGFPGFRTDGSFTVSAWVRLTGSALPSGHRAAVSKDGGERFGFHLGYLGERRTWALLANQANADKSVWGAIEAGQDSAKLGTWTHLTAIYEAKGTRDPYNKPVMTDQLRLFVNGRQTGDPVPYAVHSNAAGRLQVGRALWDGKYTDFWPGDVDEVRVFPGVPTDEEIRRLADPG